MWFWSDHLVHGLLIGLLLISACRPGEVDLPPPPTQPSAAHLWLGVSADTAYLGELVTSAFDQEGVIVHLVSGPQAELAADLAAGELDGLISHEIPDEATWFNPIAVDALVLVVHPQNPLPGLERRTARQLLTGSITGWDEIGGLPGSIQLLLREPRSTSRRMLADLLLEGRPVPVTARTLPADHLLAAAVAEDPAAVGVSWYGNLTADVSPLSIDGIAPSPTTLADQSYWLTVPVYFSSDGEPQGALRLLLAWLQGGEGQTLIHQRYGRVDG